jgi:small subunit ribosomal protein S1
MTANTDNNFEALFEKSLQKSFPHEGDIVKGEVIQITPDFVIVDFGYKSEGQVPIEEFKNHEGNVTINEGQSIEIYIDSINADDGLAALSKEKADAFKIWDHLEEAMAQNGVVEGVIVNKVKGGLTVDIGVKAFLPASQIDIRPVSNTERLIGKRFKFKILKLNKRKGNIIISRRVLVEQDRDLIRKETLQNIVEGEKMKGNVKNVTDYGVFVDLGGVDGLLHITDMTWGRVGHPSEMFNVGDDIEVMIIKVDAATGKVSLGLKQLTTDPWEGLAERFPIGTKVKGKVVNIADYGAFVALEPGVEGLVHVSEMSWTKKIKHPSKVANIDDEIEAIVLDMDTGVRRISLGMRQMQPNPWESLAEKYPVDTKIKGTIKNITDFGVFIGIDDDIDGLIHVSDLTWTRNLRSPSEMYEKGEEVEAIVLNIDQENERFSLGVKQLKPDPWSTINKKFSIGTKMKAKVLSATDRGLEVITDDEISAYIPSEDLPEDLQKELATRYKVGDEVEVIVHTVEEKDHRVVFGLVSE